MESAIRVQHLLQTNSFSRTHAQPAITHQGD